jgi:hypothetical protein
MNGCDCETWRKTTGEIPAEDDAGKKWQERAKEYLRWDAKSKCWILGIMIITHCPWCPNKLTTPTVKR